MEHVNYFKRKRALENLTISQYNDIIILKILKRM